jgi:small subunit ribosomal protein S14
MPKKSVIARNEKRRYLVNHYAEKRAKLKEAGDYIGLDKLPKNSSAGRVRNRCGVTGKARGYSRKFGVCRNILREWASQGKIPGIEKASW